MIIKEETVKNVFLYGMMPTAAAIVAVDTVPYVVNNPVSSLLFIPVYIGIADSYKKCLKRFGGVKENDE